MCVSLVSARHHFLAVFHPHWLLQSFCLVFHLISWALRWKIHQTSYLGLSVPRALSAHCPVVALISSCLLQQQASVMIADRSSKHHGLLPRQLVTLHKRQKVHTSEDTPYLCPGESYVMGGAQVEASNYCLLLITVLKENSDHQFPLAQSLWPTTVNCL